MQSSVRKRVFFCTLLLAIVFGFLSLGLDFNRGVVSKIEGPQSAAVSDSAWSLFYCDVKSFFGFPCAQTAPVPTPVVAAPEVVSVVLRPADNPATTTIVQKVVNEYVSNPVERETIREVLIRDAAVDVSRFITRQEYDAQVDAIMRSIENSSDSDDDGGTGGIEDITGESIEDLADVASMTKTIGDLLTWTGSAWANIATSSLGIIGSGAVDSVNGQTGIVVLNTSHISESGNLYFTTARSRESLSSSATGLSYATSTGVLSLAAGYQIPLIASTTEWSTAFSWGDHALANYLTTVDISDDTNLVAGDGLTFSGDMINFDGGNVPGGVLGGTWASPTLDAEITSLEDLLDVDTFTQAAGNILYWTGTGWNVTATSTWDTNTTYTAGDHLTLTGTDFDVDDDFLLNTGDDMTGNLNMLGTSANIALGSNYLSGDGGDEGVFVDSSGRVGIGTSTPGALLDLHGGTLFQNLRLVPSSNTLISFGSGLRTGLSDFSLNVDSNSSVRINFDSDNNGSSDTFEIRKDGTTTSLFTVNSSGNVGIGTSSPVGRLSVTGGGVALDTGVQIDFADEVADKIYLFGTTYGLGVSSSEANWWSGGGWSWRTNSRTGTEVMNLSSVGNLQLDGNLTVSGGGNSTFGGNVGIGTTTPSYKIDVVGDVGLSGNIIDTGGVNGDLRIGGTTQTRYLNIVTASDGAYLIGKGSSSDNLFLGTGSSSNKFLTVMSTGNVGIGTTTPSHLLTIAGDTNQTGALRFNGNAGTAGQLLISNGSSAPVWSATSSLGLASSVDELSDGYKQSDNLIIGHNGYTGTFYNQYNTAVGIGALATPNADNSQSFYGSGNTALGYLSLTNNTRGYGNTALGSEALLSNTTASYSTALGYLALTNNTTGSANTALGGEALVANITGFSNSAVGIYALSSNTTGSNNTAVGAFAIASNATSSNNTAVGAYAGNYIANGSSPATMIANSVYLGSNTKALTATDSNSIVIGYDATGLGSNSVVLGNDSITKTILKGNIGIGTTTPSAKLSIIGDGVTPSFRVSDTSGLTRLNFSTTYNLVFSEGSGNVARIAGASSSSSYLNALGGNLGIGTTTPNSLLTISGPDPVISINNTNPGTGTWQIRNKFSDLEIFSVHDNKTMLYFNDDDMVMIGTSTNIIGNASRLFVYGGPNGANIDVMGEGVVGRDQAVLDLQSSDWPTSLTSIFLRQQGPANAPLGTTMGLPVSHLAELTFFNPSAALIRVSATTSPLIIATNDVERMRITGDGNIGVGTSTPGARLSIAGSGSTANLRISDSSGTTRFNVGNSYNLVISEAFGNMAQISAASSTNSYFNALGGSVGIGTTTPTNKLSISGGNVYVENSTNPALIANHTSGVATALVAGTQRSSFLFDDTGSFSIQVRPKANVLAGNPLNTASVFEVLSNGNVGIGTTTPTEKLSVNGSILFDADTASDGLIAKNFTSGSNIFTLLRQNDVTGASLQIGAFGGIGLTAGNTNSSSAASHLFITTGGAVGIGTTTPARTLTVAGTVGFRGLTAAVGAGSLCLSASHEVVYNSGSDNCLSSTENTKHAITPLTLDAISILNALTPVSFIYNGTDRVRYGFIAEDTASVDSILATYNAEGDLTGIDDRSILSVLVRAFQEFYRNVMDKFADQDSRIEALEERISELEAREGIGSPEPEEEEPSEPVDLCPNLPETQLEVPSGYYLDPDSGECVEGEPVSDDDAPVPVLGCTDSEALNFNAEATADDGSCAYEEPIIPEEPDASEVPVVEEAGGGQAPE